MQISIRAAHAQDAVAVENVLNSSYPRLMSGTYAADLLARALPKMTRPHPKLLGSGTYLLAEIEKRAVGCGGWSLAAPGSAQTQPGVAHIRHFATATEWIGRGIGRAIYDRCETQARAAGVQLFECYSSLNGEAFYAALGFQRIGITEVPMGPDLSLPSVHMSRVL